MAFLCDSKYDNDGKNKNVNREAQTFLPEGSD